MSHNFRHIEVLRESSWQTVRLAEIKKGEKFRYTEDGVEHTHVAASDGRWCEMDGRMTLESMISHVNSIIMIEE